MASAASFTSESAGGSGSGGASGSAGTSGSAGASGSSGEKGKRPLRSSTPAPSSSVFTTDEIRSAHNWLRQAVRMLHSAGRSAHTAQIAIRFSSAILRPAENLLCASAISLGSAANCILSASSYLCSLALRPESPVSGLFFALRQASQWVCTGSSYLKYHNTQLSRTLHSTAISLAMAAASLEEAALAAADEHQRLGRSRSRSPRRRRAQGRTEGREKIHREDIPRERRHRHKRTAQKAEPISDDCRFSHILVKHKESRRPMDQYNKPITRTKNEAMDLVCDIHEKILKDLITFADAAVSFSDCTSAQYEGDIQSQFKSGKMLASFKKTATDLAPGQISNVVETQAGYHILQRRE